MTAAAASIAGRMSSAGLRVRRACSDDLPTLIRLAHRMQQESELAFLPFDPGKVTFSMMRCITSEMHYAAVAELDHQIIGFLGGLVVEYPFCRERLAHDLGFYVVPEHRASSAAVRLLRAFRSWAKERGAREVCVAVSLGGEIDRIGAFLERSGLRKMGGVYRERL
jgi:GNAT superfamily N-acetyltransferase